MLHLAGQFLEALLLPAIAGAVISGLLMLLTPRRPAVRTPAPPRRRPAARAASVPKQRSSTCMAATRYTGKRGLPSIDTARRAGAHAPQRLR